jgi:CubicO group peptidase (beta-lactamase class C family)
MASVLSRFRPVVALVVMLAIAACEGDSREPADPGPGNPTDQSIRRYLERVLPDEASGTLVAARDGEMVHCQGFGLADHEARVEATCDTAYDVMSMTKQFTAAAILRLEMMGRLRVTDPISEYLARVPADKDDITLHQLLTHTSGLVPTLGGDYERLSRRGMLTAALESELLSRPGAAYRYSNVGYSVLAAIVEKVSGVGYEQFLARQLFAPAGMSQTGYVLPAWKPEQMAVEYDPLGNARGRPDEHPWADDGPFWNLRGNGGLLSTARDMFRWHLALESHTVLDRRATEKLFEPYVLEEPGGDSSYGYGWVILPTDDGDAAWHNGGNGRSYGELTRLLDQGVMVFWITNQHQDRAAGWDFDELAQRLTQGVVTRVLTDS